MTEQFKTTLFNSEIEKYESRTGGAPKASARYIVTQIPELSGLISPDAVVHDNACGPIAVYEELVTHCRSVGADPPKAVATDVSPAMIDFAKAKISALNLEDRVTTHVLPGEKLDSIADGTFTHSIANMGVLFFQDDKAGLKEMYRTLRPGGWVTISSWGKDHLPIDCIAHPAYKEVRPDQSPMSLPSLVRWRDEAYIKNSLEEAGFGEVRLMTEDILYGQKSHESMTAVMTMGVSAMSLYADLTEEEKEKLAKGVARQVRKLAQPCTLIEGTEGVGFTCQAIFAVGRKPE